MLSSQGDQKEGSFENKKFVAVAVFANADAATAGDLEPSCPSWKREISKPLNTEQIGGPRHNSSTF
jgi:hypothetical protein